MKLKNWQSSVKKWEEIVKRTKAGMGFDGLNIVEPCGYCDEFEDDYCKNCPLFKDDYCKGSDFGRTTIFWKYIETMRRIKDTKTSKKLWLKAETLAKKMLDRIMQDKPQRR